VSLAARSRAVAALFRALSHHRMAWAVPLVAVLLLAAAVFAALSAVPAIAPFVYPLL
jgi:hypothetical protein